MRRGRAAPILAALPPRTPMWPVLFHAGPVAVGTHDAFVLAGALAALAVYVRAARGAGRLDERTLWVAIGALFGGALLARASTAWRYWLVAPDPTLWGTVLQGGRSILGGLAGAYAGAHVAKWLVGLRRSTGDLFAPAVALGLAVGRWGCFFAECPGTPTAGGWGLRLTAAQAAVLPSCPAGTGLHPSFLYESAFHALAFAVLHATRGRALPEGIRFKAYLLAYASFRFAVEFVRGNDVVWGGLTRPQLFLLVSVPVLAVAVAVATARRSSSEAVAS